MIICARNEPKLSSEVLRTYKEFLVRLGYYLELPSQDLTNTSGSLILN